MASNKKRYKITNAQLNKKVRPYGMALRRILTVNDRKVFEHQNRLEDRLLLGHWLSPRTTVRQEWIERPDGSRLRVLVCRAKDTVPDGPVTGLLWIHGGGYGSGLPEQDFLFADLFCGDGSCIAVLPDYRLSVEAPYPAALDDCYLALTYLWEHAGELGVDPEQIFVGGDSAGGGLTAAITLLARDRGEIPIAFQMPIYPMLDDREITGSSKDNDAPVWNTASNRAAWELYLSSFSPEEEIPPYAAPARGKDLSRLPPLCTYVGTVEPFYEETLEYCRRIREEGIPVHLKTFEGCFHGFDILAYPSAPAREARAFLQETFRYAQEHYRTGKPRTIDKSGEETI